MAVSPPRPGARLSAFWGRPVELEAQVLLPAGFDERPAARYPLVLQVGPGVNPTVTLENREAAAGCDREPGAKRLSCAAR